MTLNVSINLTRPHTTPNIYFGGAGVVVSRGVLSFESGAATLANKTQTLTPASITGSLGDPLVGRIDLTIDLTAPLINTHPVQVLFGDSQPIACTGDLFFEISAPVLVQASYVYAPSAGQLQMGAVRLTTAIHELNLTRAKSEATDPVYVLFGGVLLPIAPAGLATAEFGAAALTGGVSGFFIAPEGIEHPAIPSPVLSGKRQYLSLNRAATASANINFTGGPVFCVGEDMARLGEIRILGGSRFVDVTGIDAGAVAYHRVANNARLVAPPGLYSWDVRYRPDVSKGDQFAFPTGIFSFEMPQHEVKSSTQYIEPESIDSAEYSLYRCENFSRSINPEGLTTIFGSATVGTTRALLQNGSPTATLGGATVSHRKMPTPIGAVYSQYGVATVHLNRKYILAEGVPSRVELGLHDISHDVRYIHQAPGVVSSVVSTQAVVSHNPLLVLGGYADDRYGIPYVVNRSRSVYATGIAPPYEPFPQHRFRIDARVIQVSGLSGQLGDTWVSHGVRSLLTAGQEYTQFGIPTPANTGRNLTPPGTDSSELGTHTVWRYTQYVTVNYTPFDTLFGSHVLGTTRSLAPAGVPPINISGARLGTTRQVHVEGVPPDYLTPPVIANVSFTQSVKPNRVPEALYGTAGLRNTGAIFPAGIDAVWPSMPEVRNVNRTVAANSVPYGLVISTPKVELGKRFIGQYGELYQKIGRPLVWNAQQFPPTIPVVTQYVVGAGGVVDTMLPTGNPTIGHKNQMVFVEGSDEFEPGTANVAYSGIYVLSPRGPEADDGSWIQFGVAKVRTPVTQHIRPEQMSFLNGNPLNNYHVPPVGEFGELPSNQDEGTQTRFSPHTIYCQDGVQENWEFTERWIWVDDHIMPVYNGAKQTFLVGVDTRIRLANGRATTNGTSFLTMGEPTVSLSKQYLFAVGMPPPQHGAHSVSGQTIQHIRMYSYLSDVSTVFGTHTVDAVDTPDATKYVAPVGFSTIFGSTIINNFHRDLRPSGLSATLFGANRMSPTQFRTMEGFAGVLGDPWVSHGIRSIPCAGVDSFICDGISYGDAYAFSNRMRVRKTAPRIAVSSVDAGGIGDPVCYNLTQYVRARPALLTHYRDNTQRGDLSFGHEVSHGS